MIYEQQFSQAYNLLEKIKFKERKKVYKLEFFKKKEKFLRYKVNCLLYLLLNLFKE